jgi:hypothetical protein
MKIRRNQMTEIKFSEDVIASSKRVLENYECPSMKEQVNIMVSHETTLKVAREILRVHALLKKANQASEPSAPEPPPEVRVPDCLSSDWWIAVYSDGSWFMSSGRPSREAHYFFGTHGDEVPMVTGSDLILPSVPTPDSCWQISTLREMQEAYEAWENDIVVSEEFSLTADETDVDSLVVPESEDLNQMLRDRKAMELLRGEEIQMVSSPDGTRGKGWGACSAGAKWYYAEDVADAIITAAKGE